MFLKVIGFANRLNTRTETVNLANKCLPIANEILKRNAGHSEWANRKSTREASAEKRSTAIQKFQYEIRREIFRSKNANVLTNTRLQSIIGSARKANVPLATLENIIKAASVALDGSCVHSFGFIHSMGIVCVADISSLHPINARGSLSSVFKKFGFKGLENDEVHDQYTTVGIIMSKPPEEAGGNYLDKAIEDGIMANCEEVKEIDGILEFQCSTSGIDICTKKLSDLGYKIECSETRHVFTNMITVSDKISESLDIMQGKLEVVPGFMKVSYNIE